MTTFHPSILKAYDIRGIYGQTLHDDDGYHWGYLFTQYLKKKTSKKNPKICVACDTRTSSPVLSRQVIQGIVDAGGYAINMGMGPTPYLYFATKDMNADGGIMVTGSHNPSEYNGFKTLTSTDPVSGELIKEIAALPMEKKEKGRSTMKNTVSLYVVDVLTKASFFPSNIKVVWDCGNGAMGIALEAFTQSYNLKNHIPLFAEPSGDFPNHHPDPSDPKNYESLINEMEKQDAEIGFLFDGDGDRLGVVLDGEILLPDQIIAILALDYLGNWSEDNGPKVILDVKASLVLIDFIHSMRGEVVFSPCGHSLVKKLMKQEDIGFAGETSGHIFYKHNNNFDDGLLAAFTFLRIFIDRPEVVRGIIQGWAPTALSPDMRFNLNPEKFDEFLLYVENQVSEINMMVSRIDGIRASDDQGWFLIRKSNTEEVITVRIESKTKQGYERLQAYVQELFEESHCF